MSESLDAFARRWMASPVLKPPADCHAEVGGHVGITLYRDERFQVQFWSCAPGSEIADHSHPSLRGYAVQVAGRIKFRLNGRGVTRADTLLAVLMGKHTVMHPVEPGITHGASIGDKGAAFLSISEWTVPPRSVHLDWQGAPLDARHAAELGA